MKLVELQIGEKFSLLQKRQITLQPGGVCPAYDIEVLPTYQFIIHSINSKSARCSSTNMKEFSKKFKGFRFPLYLEVEKI